MNKNLIKIPSILVKYGFKHSCRLFYIYFITPIRVTIAPSLLKCYQKWNSIKCRSFLKDIEITYWKKKMDKLLKSGEHGYKLKIEELGLDKDQLHTLQNTHQASDGIVIADIDQDGFIYSPYGSIKGLPIIAKENFTKRNRFVLQIVVINGYVGVRKDYKSNKVSFLNELKALYYLGIAGCNVPTLLGIDFRNLSLTF